MTNSTVDRLILDYDWKGTVTRLVGISLVYLGMKLLPDVVAWLSVHTNVSPMSMQQTEQHRSILYIFQIVFCFALAFEAIRSLYLFSRKRIGTSKER